MAKGLFHEVVKNALVKDGWTITHDPYKLDTKQPRFDYEIDLGAERFIGAEKGVSKIAVEPGRRSGEKFSTDVYPI